MSLQAFTDFFAHFSLDWIILILLMGVLTFDALRGGLARVTALALALPLTLVFLDAMPGSRFLAGFEEQLSSPALEMAFVAVLFVVVCIIMYRITDTFSSGSYQVLQALVAGLATTVVAVVIWLQIPALDSVWLFGEPVQAVFGAVYRFWWLLGAYVALAFARG